MRAIRRRARAALSRASLVAALAGALVAVPGVAADASGADVPEGRIVFARHDGDSELFAIDTDGTRLRRLTNNSVDDFSPSWHPSGEAIAFVRYHAYRNADGRLRNNAEIWTKSLATGKLTRLTRSRYESDHDPRYSPNGVWIVSQRSLGRRYGYDSQIVAIRPRDGATRVVASARAMDVSFLNSPTWSPDGTRVAYVVQRTPPYQLAISDFDDGDVRVLPIDGDAGVCSDFESLGAVEWSPDGASLAYTAWPHSDTGALCLLPADGGEPRPVLEESPIPSLGSWAPQGTHVAGTDGSEAGSFVVIVDVAAGVIERVVTDGVSPDWIVRPAD